MNYIEMNYKQIKFSQIWKSLIANYVASDWRATTYLVVNYVIPNSQKLRAHHSADGNVFCSRCNFLDNNVLTSLLRTRLNLTISDPEELLVMNRDKKHEAGLLFSTAAIHLMHFCDVWLETRDGPRKIL
jgi:hypothetical protein